MIRTLTRGAAGLFVKAALALTVLAMPGLTPASAAGPGLRAATTSSPRTIGLGQAVLAPDASSSDLSAFAIWGQSNAVGTGAGLSVTLDRRADGRIFGIMRSPSNPVFAGRAVLAVEPIENETQAVNDGPRVGFARPFADHLVKYRSQLLNGEKVLLLRYAVGGTGFSGCPAEPNWVKGCNLSVYDGALSYVQASLVTYPRAYLRGVLWGQGEKDYAALDSPTYATTIDDFIAQTRADLNIPDLPFILTTLSPDVATFTQRSADIRTVPNRVAFTAVADDYSGGQSGLAADVMTGSIGINDEVGTGTDQDATHFSAATQRNMRGPRILAAYERALTHNNPGGVNTTPTTPASITDLAVTQNKDGYVVLDLTPPGASGGPSNGGAAIEGYVTRLSTDGGSTWFAAPARWSGKLRPLTGLTNGLSYLIQVKAFNRAGLAATWSNSATGSPVAINFATGLQHRIVPNVAGTTVVDTVAAATVVKNVTAGNDGVYDYVATNASTGYFGLTTGSVHTQSQVISVWTYNTAYAASKGVFGEWSASTQVMSALWHGTTSGSSETWRGGPGAASTAAFNSSVLTASTLNTWVHWVLIVDDDGSGTTDRYRYYRNGVLVSTATGMTRRTLGDRWMTGHGSSGTTNTLASRFATVRIYDQSVALFDADKVAALYALGPAF